MNQDWYEDDEYERWREQEDMAQMQLAFKLRAYSAAIYEIMYGKVVLPAPPPSDTGNEWDGLSLSAKTWYGLEA